jgi:hypothetical protein
MRAAELNRMSEAKSGTLRRSSGLLAIDGRVRELKSPREGCKYHVIFIPKAEEGTVAWATATRLPHWHRGGVRDSSSRFERLTQQSPGSAGDTYFRSSVKTGALTATADNFSVSSLAA